MKKLAKLVLESVRVVASDGDCVFASVAEAREGDLTPYPSHLSRPFFLCFV
jgi:hypothetical protein